MTIFLSSPRCRPIRILSAQADDLPGALPLDPVRNPPPHLHAIAVSFGAIGFHTPNRPAARRAAYIAHTRTPFSAPTEQHLLLLRDSHNLPPDLAEPIAKLRALIGDMLCPTHPKSPSPFSTPLNSSAPKSKPCSPR